MALDKIVINVSGQTDLDSTIKKLVELGHIDDRNAQSFKKHNKEFQTSIDQNTKKIDVFDQAISKIGPALAGAFAASKLIDLGKQVLDITSKFQKFEAVLTNTLGSKSAAQQSMSMILEFAAKTPFAVDEITQSYIKLVNQGFKPTMAEMTKLGDLASSQGKSLDQLTEAIIDAQTGEFERLKEFGIRASKEGEKVTFTFKEQQTTVKATASSIREYILGLGSATGVAGSMAAISQTLEGQLSNLADTFDQVLLAIGREGAGGFAAVVGAANSVLEELGNALQDKPSLFDSTKEAVLGLIRPIKELFVSVWDLITNLAELVSVGNNTDIVLKGIGIALKAAVLPLKLAIEGVIVFAHSLDTLLKSGQNVYNFFKNKPLQDIGLDKLKNDFKNIGDILSFTDGKFKHATESIIDNTEAQTKAIKEEVRSIAVLEEELKDLIKTRDNMAISNEKGILQLNNEIKAKQELIKKLKGESEGLKQAKQAKEEYYKLIKKLAEEAQKAEIDQLSGEQKLRAIRDAELKEISILEQSILEQAQKMGKKRQLTEEQQNQLQLLRDSANAKYLKSLADLNNKEQKEILDHSRKSIDLYEKIEIEKIKALDKGGMSEIEFEKYKQSKILQIQIEAAKKRLELVEDTGKQEDILMRYQLENTIKDLQKQYDNLYKVELKKAAQEYYDFVHDSIIKISDAVAENNRIKLDNELHRISEETSAQLKAIDERNRAGILSDEAAAKQKEAIQNRQARKELEIRRRQAQQDKNNALFQIAINTAAGVLKTIATLGPPVPPNFAGIAGVATTIATGALEAAIVSSKPLPQYKKGGYTGEGDVNSVAGIVHKKEFVMPADKTKEYRKELQEMYEGRFRREYKEPIKLERTLTDVRHDNMADNIYKSIMLSGQFDDRNIVNAIAKNNKVKLSNSKELAGLIASKIGDRDGERRVFA